MAESPRMKALQNLSNALPVANAQVAAGQNAARQMQIQNAIRSAPQKASITGTSQETGLAVAQNAGQQLLHNTQQNVQQQQQIGQLGLAEQARQSQAEIAAAQSGAREQAMDNVQRLAALDARAKQELYDRQIQFARDENGRTLFNAQQLADYARMNAQSDEQFRNYAQTAQQASSRKLQMMETAWKKIQEDMNFKYAQAKQSGDQETMRYIESAKAETEARMQRERARAANNAATWQAGGTIVGAAAGSFGGPVGAMAGASVGGAIGSIAGGL